jgi:hypothetical protein
VNQSTRALETASLASEAEQPLAAGRSGDGVIAV